MPLIQSLFYFAGFIAFVMAAAFFTIMLVVALKNFARLKSLMETFEDKLNAPLITALMPFLPTLIALFGEVKRSRRK